MKLSQWALTLLGVWYLAIGLIALLNSYFLFHLDQIYWFCYLSVFLIGIGLMWKDPYIIATQLNILALGLIIWTIDFGYVLFFHQPLWGITNYFFDYGYLSPKITTLQHLYTLPVALYALYVLKINKTHMWRVSLLQVSLIFVATLLFTSPARNVNCVFAPCIGVDVPYYPVAWLAAAFGMVMLTNYCITRLSFLKAR